MLSSYQEILRSGVRPKLLVVMDSGSDQGMIAKVFQDDCDIVVANDVAQVVRQCNSALPDLVVMALDMPGLDAYGVCSLLKADQRTRKIGVVLVAPQRSELDEVRAFEAGASDFITKPLNPTILGSRVRNHLLLKLRTDQLHLRERFLRNIAEKIPGPTAYWNADLRCLFSNGAYVDYFGKTTEQMLGLSIKELMGEAGFAKIEPQVMGALRGETQRFERTLVKIDGSSASTWTHYVPDIENDRVLGFFVMILDITDLKDAERALSESEQLAKTTMDTVPETICVLDKTGVIIAVNQAWRDFYDANYDNAPNVNYALGTNYLQVCESAVGANATEAPLMADGLKAVMAGERDAFSMEYPCDSPTEKRFFFTRVKRFQGDSGHVLVAHGNVTERKMIEIQLEQMAHTDVLTGLNNRRHFIELSELELSRTARHGGELSLLMLDIDHFKRVNDTHGHQVGDLAIQMLANICRQQLRELDVIGRLGGEEFAITMPSTDHAQAVLVAERLRKAIEAASVPLAKGLPLRITCSIGVTTVADKHTNLDTLLDHADQALYQSKNTGRNRVCSFRQEP